MVKVSTAKPMVHVFYTPQINQDIVNIDASPHISYLELGVASLLLALLRTRANDSMSDFNNFPFKKKENIARGQSNFRRGPPSIFIRN